MHYLHAVLWVLGLLAHVLVGCAPSDAPVVTTGSDASVDGGWRPSPADSAMPALDAAPADAPDALSAPAVTEIRVVQLNPYYAGRLEPYHVARPSCARTSDCSASGATCASADSEGCFECIDRRCRMRNYATASDAAGRIRDISADVIGVQEMPPAFRDRMIAILEDATGDPWDAVVVEQGISGRGSGVGVFWRATRLELARDLGSVDVDTLDSGYILRFAGVLLRALEGGGELAVFSGKLWWEGGQSARRGEQARVLHAWIDDQMRGEEGTARVLAIDLNDVVGSPAYQVFAADWDDGGATKSTAPGQYPDTASGRRIDYLFWSRGKPMPEEGFVTERSDGRLGRSGYFGSDHRFVYGDARIYPGT